MSKTASKSQDIGDRRSRVVVLTATREKHNWVSEKMRARDGLGLTVLRATVDTDFIFHGSVWNWEVDPDTFLIIIVSYNCRPLHRLEFTKRFHLNPGVRKLL